MASSRGRKKVREESIGNSAAATEPKKKIGRLNLPELYENFLEQQWRAEGGNLTAEKKQYIVNSTTLKSEQIEIWCQRRQQKEYPKPKNEQPLRSTKAIDTDPCYTIELPVVDLDSPESVHDSIELDSSLSPDLSERSSSAESIVSLDSPPMAATVGNSSSHSFANNNSNSGKFEGASAVAFNTAAHNRSTSELLRGGRQMRYASRSSAISEVPEVGANVIVSVDSLSRRASARPKPRRYEAYQVPGMQQAFYVFSPTTVAPTQHTQIATGLPTIYHATAAPSPAAAFHRAVYHHGSLYQTNPVANSNKVFIHTSVASGLREFPSAIAQQPQFLRLESTGVDFQSVSSMNHSATTAVCDNSRVKVETNSFPAVEQPGILTCSSRNKLFEPCLSRNGGTLNQFVKVEPMVDSKLLNFDNHNVRTAMAMTSLVGQQQVMSLPKRIRLSMDTYVNQQISNTYEVSTAFQYVVGAKNAACLLTPVHVQNEAREIPQFFSVQNTASSVASAPVNISSASASTTLAPVRISCSNIGANPMVVVSPESVKSLESGYGSCVVSPQTPKNTHADLLGSLDDPMPDLPFEYDGGTDMDISYVPLLRGTDKISDRSAVSDLSETSPQQYLSKKSSDVDHLSDDVLQLALESADIQFYNDNMMNLSIAKSLTNLPDEFSKNNSISAKPKPLCECVTCQCKYFDKLYDELHSNDTVNFASYLNLK